MMFTRANGDDLPETVDVFRTEGAERTVRKWKWKCRACGTGQMAVSKPHAFELAWNHVIGDYACEAEQDRQEALA